MRNPGGKDKSLGPVAPSKTPIYRFLEIYSIDPSLARKVDTFDVSTSSVPVPWSDYKAPGPIGDYVEVIDYDPVAGLYYTPLDLSRPETAAFGLSPEEQDPRFHQQMVYAVVMHTIKLFESALGRRILWDDRRDPTGESVFVERLRIYPHALRAKNAYYDPERKALLFGLFPPPGPKDFDREQGSVFTCLSFDIITHETTHAILDGLNRQLREPTNPDVLAFHEAFSDIVALFSHFTLPEFLEEQISSCRGDLSAENLLGKLAVEFGEGIGSHGALRDAIGRTEIVNGKPQWTPRSPADPSFDLNTVLLPHERGSILVGAVFAAFLKIFKKETMDLVRLASEGTGILRPGAISPDLTKRLARDAAAIAKVVLRICIRALDYLPPVDLNFTDFGQALLTADTERVPYDPARYRVAVLQTFLEWKIIPQAVRDKKWLTFEETFGQVFDEIWEPEDLKARADAKSIERFVETTQDLAGVCVSDEAERDDSEASEKDKYCVWRGRFATEVRKRMNLYRPEASTSAEGRETRGGPSPRAHLHEWSRQSSESLKKLFDELLEECPKIASEIFGLARHPDVEGEETPAPPGWSMAKLTVQSVRPMITVLLDDELLPRNGLTISVIQQIEIESDSSLGEDSPGYLRSGPDLKRPMTFRGGATVIYDLDKEDFHYVIYKSIRSMNRRRRQADYQKRGGGSHSLRLDTQPFRALHFGEVVV